MTGFCWRSRQDHARETFYLTVDSINIVTTHSLNSFKMANMKEFLQLFQQKRKSSANKQKPLSQLLPRGWTVPLSHFLSFKSTWELWTNYLAHLATNAIPGNQVAQIFFTNQSKVMYNLLSNMASQQRTCINELSIDDKAKFM